MNGVEIMRQLRRHAPFTATGTASGVAGWIPRRASDIVFPLLWVKEGKDK